jgi:hypothetical protein
MDAVLIFLRLATSLIFGVGTVITIVALRRAHMGREDEEGFHYLQSSHTPKVSADGETGPFAQSGVRLA